MKRMFFAMLMGVILGASSCEKSDQQSDACENGKVMTLVDRTGLDGCTWLLETDSEVFEAINLGDFDAALVNGAKYCVSYEIAEDAASICMAGTIIRLTDFKKMP